LLNLVLLKYLSLHWNGSKKGISLGGNLSSVSSVMCQERWRWYEWIGSLQWLDQMLTLRVIHEFLRRAERQKGQFAYLTRTWLKRPQAK
jgi:hypothetical protein